MNKHVKNTNKLLAINISYALNIARTSSKCRSLARTSWCRQTARVRRIRATRNAS